MNSRSCIVSVMCRLTLAASLGGCAVAPDREDAREPFSAADSGRDSFALPPGVPGWVYEGDCPPVAERDGMVNVGGPIDGVATWLVMMVAPANVEGNEASQRCAIRAAIELGMVYVPEDGVWLNLFSVRGTLEAATALARRPDVHSVLTSGSSPGQFLLPCDDHIPCPASSFCARYLACTGPGVCSPTGIVCQVYHEPVCGCDGVTYDNGCAATQAGQSVRSTGACR